LKVAVYIDGFNLYYRALKGTQHKWLNPQSLAERLIRPDDRIVRLRYFTARIAARASDPDAPRRQQIYLSALSSLPELDIHYGTFLSKTIRRPLASDPSRFVDVLTSEEKGSDVNLATHLLNDGWKGDYEVALVLSQDTDLVEPLKIVRDELGLIVGLVWLDRRRPSPPLQGAASFVRHATRSHIAAAQFPPSVMVKGRQVSKPAGW